MMTEPGKLNDHMLDDKITQTTDELVKCLEVQIARDEKKLKKRKELLEKLKEMP